MYNKSYLGVLVRKLSCKYYNAYDWHFFIKLYALLLDYNRIDVIFSDEYLHFYHLYGFTKLREKRKLEDLLEHLEEDSYLFI